MQRITTSTTLSYSLFEGGRERGKEGGKEEGRDRGS